MTGRQRRCLGEDCSPRRIVFCSTPSPSSGRKRGFPSHPEIRPCIDFQARGLRSGPYQTPARPNNTLQLRRENEATIYHVDCLLPSASDSDPPARATEMHGRHRADCRRCARVRVRMYVPRRRDPLEYRLLRLMFVRLRFTLHCLLCA